MKTSQFVDLLRGQPELPLTFEYQPGQLVREDYHITEIKNVDFDTVDCGGVRNQWQEVHVQLWENEVLEPHHSVTTQKALSIFDAVNDVRPTVGDVEIKFEYSNADFPMATLPVRGMLVQENRIVVQLGQESTCCKAKERATTEEEAAAACCAPVPADAVETKVNAASTSEESSLPMAGDCTPGGGCC